LGFGRLWLGPVPRAPIRGEPGAPPTALFSHVYKTRLALPSTCISFHLPFLPPSLPGLIEPDALPLFLCPFPRRPLACPPPPPPQPDLYSCTPPCPFFVLFLSAPSLLLMPASCCCPPPAAAHLLLLPASCRCPPPAAACLLPLPASRCCPPPAAARLPLLPTSCCCPFLLSIHNGLKTLQTI
jgi:hypothetical protein